MILKLSMQHRVFEYYRIPSNDDTGFTLTYFTARSNLVPYAFVWEKVKTMDFLEIIVVHDIKVGRWSQLNEYMKLWVPKVKDIHWPWSKSLRFNIFKLLFLNNGLADWSQISYGASLGWGNESIFKWSRSHDQDGHHAHIWLKALKILVSGTEKLMTLKLGLQHQVLTSLFKWWPWVDIDLFYSKVKFGPVCFCMEKK